MSVRLQVSVQTSAPPDTVWAEMTDWEGQRRWIPLTTVRVRSGHDQGVGVRLVALSGLWLGRLPLGLLDNFVVTGWTPPVDDSFGELEVLHLGPYFTGEGAFRVESDGEAGSVITATELFSLPGGRPVEAAVALALPVMRRGFLGSLAALRRVSEQAAARQSSA